MAHQHLFLPHLEQMNAKELPQEERRKRMCNQSRRNRGVIISTSRKRKFAIVVGSINVYHRSVQTQVVPQNFEPAQIVHFIEEGTWFHVPRLCDTPVRPPWISRYAMFATPVKIDKNAMLPHSNQNVRGLEIRKHYILAVQYLDSSLHVAVNSL